MNLIRTIFVVGMCLTLVESRFGIAYAGMIPTGEVVTVQTNAENRTKVERFVQRQDIGQQMAKYGVSADEASKRIASLSDQEVQKLAVQIDQGQAGGDVVVISLGTVIAVLVILILIGKL